MFKVILVDDEPFILDIIEKSINWEKYGMEIAGKFYNGGQAFEYVAKNDVDVIISDIKMPVMDGEQLLLEVKKIKPDIEFVVLSAYEEFELVRGLFKNGIFDYMMKIDIDSDKTGAVMSKLQMELMKKRAVGNDMKSVMDYFRASVGESSGCFVILTLCVPSRSGLQKFNEFVRNTEKYRSGDICYKFSDTELVVLLECGERLSSKLDMINLTLSNVPYKILCGISGEASPAHFEDMLAQARKSANYSFYTDTAKVISFSDIPQRKPDVSETNDTDIVKCREDIRKYISEMNMEKIKERFFVLTDVYKRYNMPCSELKDKAAELLMYINHMMRSKGMIDEVFEENAKYIISVIDDMETFTALNTLIEDYINVFSSTAGESSAAGLVKRIKLYIDENFDKDLKLKDISKKFGISENYFSRVFTKENGLSFKQYLLLLRIERAKTYLHSTAMQIQEICEKVGFSSTEHFSRLFKAETGFSPMEYRRRSKK